MQAILGMAESEEMVFWPPCDVMHEVAVSFPKRSGDVRPVCARSHVLSHVLVGPYHVLWPAASPRSAAVTNSRAYAIQTAPNPAADATATSEAQSAGHEVSDNCQGDRTPTNISIVIPLFCVGLHGLQHALVPPGLCAALRAQGQSGAVLRGGKHGCEG